MVLLSFLNGVEKFCGTMCIVEPSGEAICVIFILLCNFVLLFKSSVFVGSRGCKKIARKIDHAARLTRFFSSLRIFSRYSWKMCEKPVIFEYKIEFFWRSVRESWLALCLPSNFPTHFEYALGRVGTIRAEASRRRAACGVLEGRGQSRRQVAPGNTR